MAQKRRKPLKKKPKQPAKIPRSPDETMAEVKRLARAGVEFVAGRGNQLNELDFAGQTFYVLSDIIDTTIDTGQAGRVGIAAHCKYCIMAAYQYGLSGITPDFLPGEAMARLLGTVQNIHDKDMERIKQVAASLMGTLLSKKLTGEGKLASARLHVWTIWDLGKERRIKNEH